MQGIIILAPIALTVYAVLSLFTFVDNILPNVAGRFFPGIFGTNADGSSTKIPGIGFILVTTLVIFVGYISSSYIVARLVELLDKILEKTPGIRIIYSTLKDFFEAFAGNKRKFNKAVLVQTGAEGVWQIGFITHTDCRQFGLEGHVAVYVPKSYAFAGQLYFVAGSKIRLLTDISSSDAMKFAISGGVTELDEEIALSKQAQSIPG